MPGTNHRLLPSWSLLAGLALAAYYGFAFRPLSYRTAAQDGPLTNVWERLMATNLNSEACAGMNLENFSQRKRGLQAMLTNLESMRRLIEARIEPPAEVRNRMAESFLLIDFQNERVRQTEQLLRLGKEKGLAFEPGATNGLPEYSVDIAEPTLLWCRMHFTVQVLLTAVHSRLASIRTVQQLPSVSHYPSESDPYCLEEMRLGLEVVGSMDAVSRFLAALPLRGADLKAVGLAEVLTNKPVVFIDRVLARKQAPDKPGDILVGLTVGGFVPWSDERRRPAAF